MFGNKFTIISMLAVIGSAFILNAMFPSIPSVFYLIEAIIGGILITIFSRVLAKKKNEVLTDERIKKNTNEASYITFRTTFILACLTGTIIMVIPNVDSVILIIGRVLLAVGIFQSILFSISYKVKDIQTK